MAQSHVEHHWEYSYYPLILAAGIFFAVPLAFASMFQYENGLMAAIFAGIGVPLIVIGIAGWTAEGISDKQGQGYAVSGIPIFIVSEAMIFLCLFISYWMLRLSAPEWPPEGSPEIGVGLPIIMTFVLVASSFTYHFGEIKMEAEDGSGFIKWLIISMVLGTVFLLMTGYEYNHLLSQGFEWGTNAKSTAFYSITGFHASHVLVGLCIFLTVLIPAFAGNINQTFVKSAGIYWHFVDIVWFFVVSQIYLW